MKSNKSFANEYGITQKSIGKNVSSGIGLNPNLNIEDEYIENLLKQVNQVGVIVDLNRKEKQKQNKGMGIMGLLNKDQNPVVTHAITSNAKYSEMKNNLSNLVNTAEVQYLRLDDQNYAVKSQRDFVQRLSLKEEQINIQNKIYVDNTLNDSREALNEQFKKLKQMRQEHKKTSEYYHRLHQEWQDLKNKTRAKQLLKGINANLQNQGQTLKEKHFTISSTKLETNQAKIANFDKLFKEDPAYVKLLQQNSELKDKVKRTDKQLFDTNYKAKEMEELKKFSIRNKDQEAQQKKQAQEQAERLKKKLADKKTDLQAKIKESKAGLETNDQIRLLKGKIARKDKEISDLRKKTQVSENNFKRLRDEVQKLQLLTKEKKEKNKQKQDQLKELTMAKNSEQKVLNERQADFDKSRSDLNALEATLKDTKKRAEGLEEQNSYLTAKQQFLTKQVNLDEGLKNVKIEQLQSLMNSNSGLNNTITNLMTRWTQIIQFSHQPPS